MFDTLPQNAHGITRRPTLDHAVCLFVFVVVVFFLFCFFNEIVLSCRVPTFRGQKVVKHAGADLI